MEQEDLPARATETGNYAMAKLRELQKHNPLIGEVRGLGLMIGVELVKDEKLTPATSEAEAIRDGLAAPGSAGRRGRRLWQRHPLPAATDHYAAANRSRD